MRRVLSVFIASPSDLTAERKKTYEVVTEVNDVLRTIDWSVDLLGWEDTLPGFGRPQALIDRDVERCDLFIGMLWRRWGTPPAEDSEFSSGFEEEFSIAKSRREQSASPEIWMFFKTVDSAQLSDAGSQLQHVVAFRETLVAGKAIFFKEFEDVDAWEKMLRKFLTQYVLDIARPESNAPEGPTEVASPTKSVSLEASGSGGPAAGRQIAALMRSLAPALETGDLRKIAAALNDVDEVTFFAVRSLLLSATLVAQSRSSETPLPIHELNTLYRYRDRLQATDEELYVLFRTVLGDDLDRKPGWYWFRDRGYDNVVDSLVTVAVFDDNTAARSRSFEILRQGQVGILAAVSDPVLKHCFKELPSDLHDAVWGYLVDVVMPDDLEALKKLSNGTWLEARLDWLQTWIETGRDLDAFLLKFPDPQLIPEPIKRLILARISQLDDASLHALKSMPRPDLSLAATAELQSRGIPTSEHTLRTERLAMTASLLGFASAPSKENAEEDEMYDRLSREDSASLRESLDWYKLDGPASYRLLVERDEIPKEIVRTDLLDKFQRIEAETDRRMEKAFGPAIAAKFREEFEKLREFIIGTYTAEALAALAVEPTTEDVAVARRFLNDTYVRPTALRIVVSRGTAADVNDLIEIARSSFGEVRTLALDGVQRLAVDRAGTARTLIAAEAREMRRAALSIVAGLGDADALPLLEELLSHDDADLCVAAVGQFRRRCDREALSDVLRTYMKNDRYFYDVVTWLDRAVYAPAPISSYYENEFERKLER